MLALAVIPRSPAGLSPRQPNPRLERSIASLALRMETQGYFSRAEATRILNQRLVVADVPEPLDLSHFIQFVQRQVQLDRAQSHPVTAAAVIHSSLDLELQRKIQNILDTRLTNLRNEGVGNGAVLVVDHQLNEVLSWVVGYAGKADQPFNRINAVLVPRQPGSALKPFVYALALERGWSAATMIDDSPLQSQVGSGMHQYHNYSRHHYGLIPLREALGNSLNIPALKAAEYVGTSACLSFLHELGIDSLNEHPNVYGDGIALGNGEISLFELVQAYATLARMGKFAPLKVLQGDSLSQAEDAKHTNLVIEESVASLLADILSDPTAREKEFGWHSILNFPYQTAVKTGTSSDYRDAWAVGYNDRFTVGVWMGNMDYQPMHEVTGSSGPAIVLRSVFHELNKNREVQPLFLSDELQRSRICRETGKPADGFCESRDELFTERQRLAFEGSTLPVADSVQAESSKLMPRIRKPSQGLNIALDPRIPDEAEYFEFELAAVDGVTRVDWYVNDKLLASTKSAKVLWQVNRGEFKTHAVVWREGDDRALQTEAVSYVVH
jgi:penicillin-binding protein 1C